MPTGAHFDAQYQKHRAWGAACTVAGAGHAQPETSLTLLLLQSASSHIQLRTSASWPLPLLDIGQQDACL